MKMNNFVARSEQKPKIIAEVIGSPIIADAICDRIVHDSYRIIIECEESMRKIFGVEQSKE